MKIFLSCGIWNMEDQFFVKLSRLTVSKTYYVSFDLMMLQFDDLAGHQTNFHLLEMYLKCGINLLDAFVSGPNLTANEQLVMFRGHCPFSQYVPLKLRKYGIKICAICNSTSHSSSFGFSLFGVATVQKYFPFVLIDFVSLLSSNLFHVFSCQMHPPSPWPSSFPSTWHHHLHHPFSHTAFFSSLVHTSVALHFEVDAEATQHHITY